MRLRGPAVVAVACLVLGGSAISHRGASPRLIAGGPLPPESLSSEATDRFLLPDEDGVFHADLGELQAEYQEAQSRQLAARSARPGTPADRLRALRQTKRMIAYQRKAASAQEQPQTGTGSGWQSLGPHNLGGRSLALVVDPRNPNTIYVGGVAGGVWKSTDGGAGWRPLSDTAGNLAVSSLAIDPANPDVLYAGTGDTVEFYHRRGARGAGIMLSRDAGQNWAFIASTRTQDFAYVNQIEVSEKDGRRLYVSTATGFWLSTDGGQNWQNTYRASDVFGCLDFDVSSSGGSDRILMSCGGGREGEGIFLSTDDGRSWNQVVGRVNQIVPGRSDVKFAPSDPSVAYASVSSALNNGSLAVALLRSNQGGEAGSWEIVNEPVPNKAGSPPWFGWCDFPEDSFQSGQGHYGNVLEVSPTDPDTVFIGGVDVFRSDDGGRSLYPISYWWIDDTSGFQGSDGTQYAHADQHAFAFHPGWDGSGNQSFFIANDGGIFRTDNALARADDADCTHSGNDVRWRSLNDGYVTSLFREGVVTESGVVAGGLQDNGTWMDDQITSAPNPWRQILGGDGGWTAADPSGSVFYGTYPNGAAEKVVGPNRLDASRGLDIGQGLFVTPMVMDPTNPDVLWMGLTRMFRTTNGAQFWEPVSAQTPAPIETIAVSPRNGAFVVASAEDGSLFRTTNGYDPLPQWEQVGRGLPASTIAAIGFDPQNDQTLYAVIGSFEDVGTVFKSTDGGVSWTNIDGSGNEGIPDTAAYAVAVNPLNPQMVYVGTDTGIFESRNGGQSWTVAKQGLASTTVEDLTFQPGTSKLFAFTYGRGVYGVDVGR